MPNAIGAMFERYLDTAPNKFFNDTNRFLGLLDDGFFKLGQHSALLGQNISKLQGKTALEDKSRSVAGGFEASRATISMVRWIFPIHKFLTGQTIWQTNLHGESPGWRKVLVQNGRPVVITREELNQKWEKTEEGIWVNRTENQRSIDGKYIEDDAHGQSITRNWMDILMDICIFVARGLSPFRWLHNLKALDLGHHAKWMGSIVMGAWACVVSIGFVQAIYDLNEEVNTAKLGQRMWDLFQSTIDVPALVFDFGVGASKPFLAIAGSALNMLSAGSLIAREIYYYG